MTEVIKIIVPVVAEFILACVFVVASSFLAGILCDFIGSPI